MCLNVHRCVVCAKRGGTDVELARDPTVKDRARLLCVAHRNETEGSNTIESAFDNGKYFRIFHFFSLLLFNSQYYSLFIIHYYSYYLLLLFLDKLPPPDKNPDWAGAFRRASNPPPPLPAKKGQPQHLQQQNIAPESSARQSLMEEGAVLEETTSERGTATSPTLSRRQTKPARPVRSFSFLEILSIFRSFFSLLLFNFLRL